MTAFGEAKISDDDVVIMEEDVSEFEVSVHDFVFVEFLEAVHDLHEEIDAFLFAEEVIFFYMVFDVSVVAVVEDEVVVVCGLEVLEEMEDVWVLEFGHDRHFGVEELS